MKVSLVFLFVLALPAITLADEKCAKLEAANDVLKCVVSNHAVIQLSKAKLNEVALGIGVASQRPNPELTIEASDLGQFGYSSEVSILHTFELGGKRSARMRLAESKRDFSKANLLNSQEKLSIQTVSDLYRLRQIDHELGVIKEIIFTFKRITKQYSSVGKLSPENKISVSVFRMAFEEHKLKKTSLINEKQGIIARMEAGLGKEISLNSDLLPKIKKDWPKISPGKLAGSQILKAAIKLDISNASYKLEKAKSWPNLSIGPKVQIASSVQQSTGYGIATSIPLPLYQVNGGGRAKSLAGVRLRELQLNYTRANFERKKKYLYEVYNRISDSITKTFSNEKINIKHKNLHKMINRGVVSAPIVIELHRQIMDYYEKLHEQELQGVEAFWQILALEGRILTEELK